LTLCEGVNSCLWLHCCATSDLSLWEETIPLTISTLHIEAIWCPVEYVWVWIVICNIYISARLYLLLYEGMYIFFKSGRLRFEVGRLPSFSFFYICSLPYINQYFTNKYEVKIRRRQQDYVVELITRENDSENEKWLN